MAQVFHRLQRISFRNFLMLVSLGAVLLLMLLLSSVFFFKIKHFIEEKKHFIVTTRMNQLSFEINSSFSNVYFMLNNVLSNERLLGYTQGLGSSSTSMLEKYMLSIHFEKYLQSLVQENELIDSILVVTPQSQFSSDHTYLDFELNGIMLKSEPDKESNLVLLGEASERLVPPEGNEPSMALAQAMQSLDQRMFFAANLTNRTGAHEGILLILLNMNYFKESLPYNDNFTLFDSNGHFIYRGNQTDQAANGLEEHETSIPFQDFRLLYVDRMDFYHEQLFLMIRLIAVTCLLTFVVAFVSSRVISSKVLYPVYKLITLFQSYDISKDNLNYYTELTTRTRHLHLRDRFLIYFITTILLPLIVFMSIFYWKSSQIVADDLQKGHQSLFEKTYSLLENDMNRIEVLMARISMDKTIQDDILSNNMDKLQKNLQNENYFLGHNRSTISIYDPSNKLMFSSRYKQAKKMDPEFYERLKSSGRVIGYHLTKDDHGSVSIELGMPMIQLDKYPQVAGYVTVELDSGYGSNLYAEFRQNGSEGFIVDRDQRIISHPISGQVGTIFDSNAPDNKKYFVYVKDISGVPWKFISRYNYSEVQRQVVNLFLNDSYILFLIFLLMLLLSYYMSQRMLTPLGRLNRMLGEYELGRGRQLLFDRMSGIEEVDLLGSNFNRMIRRIDDLVQETLVASQERIKLAYEKKEIQMIALQSQINPHFLYNTLDNLLHLVEIHETDKAVDMIGSLSRLFRYITNREHMIRIREEISYAKTYAGIMSQRYHNFHCVWHIDDEVLDCKTLKLILQPIIENALHHGARKARKHVTIEIWCCKEGDSIRLVVKDDAAGMMEAELQEVRARLSDSETTKAGIYNVNARIKLHFGEAYGLYINSIYGEGTMVTILLPA
ncbi:sensor histidine kinase [Paenibacillus silviterrae]|uniref:sensor histidine kinase n=1 Tax=Paenibacillus silviterrae TaxID=3242194 RepID=UPI002542E109|nr:sensor histidine kinase [Paenibacillus chinjuensis]